MYTTSSFAWNKIGCGRGRAGGNETMMKVTWADGSKKEELPRRRFSDIYIYKSVDRL